MKVYVITKDIPYEDSDILAVFSSKKKASDYIKKRYPDNVDGLIDTQLEISVNVESYVVDKP